MADETRTTESEGPRPECGQEFVILSTLTTDLHRQVARDEPIALWEWCRAHGIGEHMKQPVAYGYSESEPFRHWVFSIVSRGAEETAIVAPASALSRADAYLK